MSEECIMLTCLSAAGATDAPNYLHLSNSSHVERCPAQDDSTLMAVATRQDLVDAETVLRQRQIKEHQEHGVTFRDPDNTFISVGVDIGKDSVIGVGVQLYGNTSIGR
jgi:bifunctional UDP-N-acetylglucosamine pyrophosphorylase/glucosamine-1-phosphate N-acetyltransferase